MANCSVDGCKSPYLAKGFCERHYSRWKRYGNPLSGRVSPGEARQFLDNVVMPYDGKECLKWPFAVDRKGYGKLYVDGKTHRVPRLVCAAAHGDAPTREHEAAHSCGVPSCCNRLHLRWATASENQSDRVLHGTSNRGERSHSVKLGAEDVRAIRSSDETEASLARRYGVKPPTIRKIRIGENWAWLTA
jgi:hypothetical protein